ncbi:MAG: polysaccharide biosynthesis tyrosine autokinase [Flavobacteriaceae bacterium]|nr:polysaccharide biosynthesis tyrosine autokinase [Flavobacteriaceae bacterium]
MNREFQSQFFTEEDTSFDLKDEVLRYFRYWPWFITFLLLALASSYVYLRYAPRIYQTSAKIKILDESKGLELPTSAFVFNRSNINLDNETEIITSYRILEQVALELGLTSSFYEVGRIQTTQQASIPIYYEQLIPVDSIKRVLSYTLITTNKGFEIINNKNENKLFVSNYDTSSVENDLPFHIKIEDSDNLNEILDKTYIININPLNRVVLGLKSTLKVEHVGDYSDLLKLSLKGVSPERSERILNKIIEVFNNDGISDRQMVSKRTIDFIDDRFVYLAEELDSIEVDKKIFKQENDLIYIESDTQLSLGNRTEAEKAVFNVESQLAIVGLLENALQTDLIELLPANIGIDNANVNSLIQEYNTGVLDRTKLISSGGINNPSVQLANSNLIDLKQNINRSLITYKKQLELTLSQLLKRSNKFRGEVSRLPLKEKLLRAIERQQNIKESLYLLLLQKREEAAINFAITEPSIKVVEHALSGSSPISPKRNIVYAAAVLLGLLIPFGFLYIKFMLDTKIHGKRDVERINPEVPVVGEIPEIKDNQTNVFSNPNDRSPLAESFRILSSNVNYIIEPSETGKVIFCTSTIKGEGKTFVSLNLSLAISSLNKKVLLIGADLRNPQIHAYLNKNKNDDGLTNYLYETDFDWKKALIRGFGKHRQHDTLISGNLPPNPAFLLTNGRFEQLLEEAKQEYDYIIVDTAPTILVTDTLLITHLADTTLFVTRADFTEKNLLEHSVDLYKQKKIQNMAYVINSVGANKSYGYNYGYGYGYHEQDS